MDEMWVCTYCGEKNDVTRNKCSVCFKTKSTKVKLCPLCSTQNHTSKEYCRKCGIKLSTDKIGIIRKDTVTAPKSNIQTQKKEAQIEKQAPIEPNKSEENISSIGNAKSFVSLLDKKQQPSKHEENRQDIKDLSLKIVLLLLTPIFAVYLFIILGTLTSLSFGDEVWKPLVWINIENPIWWLGVVLIFGIFGVLIGWYDSNQMNHNQSNRNLKSFGIGLVCGIVVFLSSYVLMFLLGVIGWLYIAQVM